jgi:hypothetical protein
MTLGTADREEWNLFGGTVDVHNLTVSDSDANSYMWHIRGGGRGRGAETLSGTLTILWQFTGGLWFKFQQTWKIVKVTEDCCCSDMRKVSLLWAQWLWILKLYNSTLWCVKFKLGGRGPYATFVVILTVSALVNITGTNKLHRNIPVCRIGLAHKNMNA